MYYASGWFSPEQEENYQTFTTILKNANIELFEPRFDAGNLGDGPLTIDRARRIFQNDLKGINSCDGIFADISFRDSGVLVEIGYSIKSKEIKDEAEKALMKWLNAQADYSSHLIDFEQFQLAKEEYYKALENIVFSNKVSEITILDNSSRQKMNIMLASAADNCIRNEEEANDYVSGENVFDLGNKELE
ncbi:MAG: nucleoside 2-deoxyribosyltransferase [Methanobrevibacter sp.]|nr:nucleoside 2-deoxyribosyltransferase [Methanobrevibacter sp.]